MFNKKNFIFIITLIAAILVTISIIYFSKSKQIFTNLNVSNTQNTEVNKDENNMESFYTYQVQEQLKPSGLDGISDNQINDHWNLYKGYVAQTNKLNQDLSEISAKNQADSLIYADRRRQYGFEYNGMILHEYYFGNLTSKKTSLQSPELKNAIESTWGTFPNWLNDFINTGKTRGIGWAILYADTTTGKLTNHFIAEHQIGNIAGFAPILVMDVWEHAYMVDHKAGGRPDYIQAFIKNINWEIVEQRYKDILNGKITKRS